MALEVFDPTLNESDRERIILYGSAGVGKSRFGLCVPEEPFGDILLYAADENSEFLHSISPEQRMSGRIKVIKPRTEWTDPETGEIKKGDPITNFQQFCMTDWKKVFPTVKTIVVDTYTKVAMDCIQYAANTGAIDREMHYKIGDPNDGGQAIPNRSDYQGIESLSRGFIDTIFDKQRDMHIIFICHEDSKQVGNVGVVGGPSHPGRKMTQDLPAKFSTVIRLIRDPVLIPGDSVPTMKVIAVTDHDGQYIAKMREGDYEKGNGLSRIALDKNPVNFWNMYLEFVQMRSKLTQESA